MPAALRLFRPFERFLDVEMRAGTLLVLATVAALVWANSPASALYFAAWAAPAAITVGPWALAMPVLGWINDLLMAVFFLLVGLEIKRELLVGELASPRKAALPLIAAVGGMAAPALVYLALAGGVAPSGWGIPMATDIAFSLGVARLLGARVPPALLAFLTAFAIADDLGAVLVIALFYGHAPDLGALGAAAGVCAVLAAMNRLGVRSLAAYCALGVPLWLAVHASGLHATLAGVAVAAFVPAPGSDRSAALAQADAAIDRARAGDAELALEQIEHYADTAQSPLGNLVQFLHPWVAYAILPLFALANAGIDVRGLSPSTLLEPTAIGVALGLFLGKPVGITLASWVAVRVRVAELPAGCGWDTLAGAGLLGGIGFTMSLFVAGLAFPSDPALHVDAKLGILVGSLVSAAAGLGWLGFAARRR